MEEILIVMIYNNGIIDHLHFNDTSDVSESTASPPHTYIEISLLMRVIAMVAIGIGHLVLYVAVRCDLR